MIPVRIAQIAPLFESVPPQGYGGTERVIAALCDGLTEAGHDVTLFAADSSSTLARLEPMVSAPLRTRMSRAEMIDVAPHLHLRMLAEAYARAGDFDVIHAHTDLWTLPFVAGSPTPTLVTMHGRLDLDTVRRVVPAYRDVPIVSISDHQRLPLAGRLVRWAGTVHNGLDLSRYLRTPTGAGDYLAFVGRINPEKRPDMAVEVARRTGYGLHVAAKVDPLDVDYFEHDIEPLFARSDVRFLGEIGEADKPTFYAGAAATLFPSDWPEPFGLVMIESIAAGTPVIALRRGSVPEVLVDGVSGFICDDLDEMVAAVGRLDEIDPDECRRQALRFTKPTMCTAYLRLYRSLLHERSLVRERSSRMGRAAIAMTAARSA